MLGKFSVILKDTSLHINIPARTEVLQKLHIQQLYTRRDVKTCALSPLFNF